MAEPKENSLELVVNLINLNYNEDSEILQRSPSLLGYSKLLYHIQEKREIAKNFKKSGIPLDVIAQNTGLSPEEIEAL